MNEMSPAVGGPDSPSEPGAPRPLADRVRRGMIALGVVAMLFAAVFWVLDESGKPSAVPYLPIGIAGLVLYNLARLPAYLRLLLPKPEAPGEKFHRK